MCVLQLFDWPLNTCRREISSEMTQMPVRSAANTHFDCHYRHDSHHESTIILMLILNAILKLSHGNIIMSGGFDLHSLFIATTAQLTKISSGMRHDGIIKSSVFHSGTVSRASGQSYG